MTTTPRNPGDIDHVGIRADGEPTLVYIDPATARLIARVTDGTTFGVCEFVQQAINEKLKGTRRGKAIND